MEGVWMGILAWGGWHPCWGAGVWVGFAIRWCRFAQPLATGWEASGFRGSGSIGFMGLRC